jgi:hypothetical protein
MLISNPCTGILKHADATPSVQGKCGLTLHQCLALGESPGNAPCKMLGLVDGYVRPRQGSAKNIQLF